MCIRDRVLSNAKRRKICVETNERLAPPDALVLEGTDTPMRVHPGLVLQGATPAKTRGVCNGLLYEIIRVGADTITLRDDLGEYEVPHDFVAKFMKLSHARTIFQAQSSTLRGIVAVHDLDAYVFNTRHLLVAVSRATHHSNVRIKT